MKSRGLPERFTNMEAVSVKKTVIVVLTLVFEIATQVVGSLWYDAFPGWMWSICDCSILVIPVIFGLGAGILCCLPNTICEIVWFVGKGYAGALMHGISFLAMVIVLGLVHKRAERLGPTMSMAVRMLAFEIAVVVEEFLYLVLRFAVLQEPQDWGAAFVNVFSVGNALCLAVLVIMLVASKMRAPR